MVADPTTTTTTRSLSCCDEEGVSVALLCEAAEGCDGVDKEDATLCGGCCCCFSKDRASPTQSLMSTRRRSLLLRGERLGLR